MPKNNKSITADAAVVPGINVTYTATDLKQYRTAGGTSATNPKTVAYSSFGAVNTSYGNSTFSGKTATVTKATIIDYVMGYVGIETQVTVPALTEYTVTYSFSMSLQKNATPASAITVTNELYYYGNSSVPGEGDQSATMMFYGSGQKAVSSTGNSYSLALLTTNTINKQSTTGSVPVTYTNNSSTAQTYTAYFGYWGFMGLATATPSSFTSSATFTSEKLTSVKAIGAPSVDTLSTPYNGQMQNFTISYDTDRVEVSKAVYTPMVGVAQTIYEYDTVNGSVITGSNPVGSNGIMQAKDAGTYTLYFDIKEDCGAVWDSTTNDQSTKTVTFTITRKKLKVPGVSAPQQYTGSLLQYSLIDFNGGQDIKMDGVSPAVAGHTVTDVNGNVPTDTTDTFLVTSVDKYTVVISPRDTNNYEWDDAQGGTGSRQVTFEVEKRELNVTFVCSEPAGVGVGAEWEFGNQNATLEVELDSNAGETVYVQVYYDVAANVLYSGAQSGAATQIKMPSTMQVGAHTVTVVLDGTQGDNENYQITTNNTFTINIKAGTASTNFGWLYYEGTAASASGSIADNGQLAYKYEGNTTTAVVYRVELDTTQLPTHISIDTAKYINGYQTNSGATVGTYTSKVALVSNNPNMLFTDANGKQSATTELSLNWEIIKGTYDFTGLMWTYEYIDADGKTQTGDYTTALEYNDGRSITLNVKASTLPAGFTIDTTMYFGDKQSGVNTYTATVNDAYCNYDRSNFNAPSATDLTKSWEIKKKNLYTQWQPVAVQYSNVNGSGSYITMALRLPQGYEKYVTYVYYDMDNGAAQVTAADIENNASPTQIHNYKVEAYVDPAYATRYEVTNSGNVPFTVFQTGSNNKIANVSITGENCLTPIKVTYDGQAHFGVGEISIVGDDGQVITDYTVTYYAGAAVAGNEITGEPQNAGKYVVEITLGASVVNDYILLTSLVDLEIMPQEIELPELGEIVFSGEYINLEDYLGGSYGEYKEIITLSGDYAEIRNVSASGYIAKLVITDSNYKWAIPQVQPATVKAEIKLSPAGGEFTVNTGDEQTAELKWNISPLVVDTSSMWNKGSSGATLNLPENINKLISGETLTLGYKYYDDAGQYIESPEIKGGKSFRVEAVFGGIDAESGNVVFKTADGNIGTVSDRISYTVPQSGAAAFFGNALSFLKSNWLWFVIALAVLLFLIILIVIIAKRRKNKEERLAKKEAKEEEKRRREEEREEEKRRREEEREAEKRRREQELELEKAKQEAELAKMKAQLGLGAGVAGIAMAAQPQQAPAQAQPQVMQQPYPQMQATPTQQSQPQSYQAPAQPYPPMQQQPYPQMQGYDGGAIARLEEEFKAMRNEQRTDAKLENELLKLRLDMHGGQPQQQMQTQPMQFMPVQGQYTPMQNMYGAPQYMNGDANMLAEKFGLMMAAMMKNMGVPPQSVMPKEIPQAQEESKPVSVTYPNDAIITTTTTVDTTKNKPAAPRSDDGRLFDVDGFYDAFDENK